MSIVPARESIAQESVGAGGYRQGLSESWVFDLRVRGVAMC
jgi:hypothetical protein